MSITSKVIFYALALLVLVVVVIGLIVWPNYRDANEVNAQIAGLYGKINSFASQAQALERLARDVRHTQRAIRTNLKEIPDSPDVELLIGKLSLPIDGRSIRDQTFTTGQPSIAVPNSSITAQVLPVTVEMHARFDSIFATMRLAETMDRLVRVTNVRIERDQQGKTEQARLGNRPLLLATIGLEAVYDPPGSRGSTTEPSRTTSNAGGAESRRVASGESQTGGAPR